MKNFVRVVIFAMLLASPDCFAETLFSDDFEWGSDWNSSQGVTIPNNNGWSSLLMNNRGGSYEAGYVDTKNAKSGSRGFTQYWDNTDSYGSAQECAFLKSSLSLPDEFFVGFNYKVDPNWAWGSASRLKITRHYTSTSDSVIPTWSNFCATCEDGEGNCTWTAGQQLPPSRCSSDMAVGLSDAKQWGACWNEVDDGEWHSFIYRYKHSTGEIQTWLDGIDITSPTPPEQGYSGTGWDQSYGIRFGGNISDGGPASEYYTAYDDFIVATTKAEVDDFLGTGDEPESPGTTIRASGTANWR